MPLKQDTKHFLKQMLGRNLKYKTCKVATIKYYMMATYIYLRVYDALFA